MPSSSASTFASGASATASTADGTIVSAEHDQRLAAKIRDLELQSKQRAAEAATAGETERGYVVVDGKERAALVRSPESQDVSIETAEKWERQLLEDPKNRLALHACTSNATTSIISSRASRITTPHTYNVTLPMEGGPVTNQRASGRCWLFASTNVFRVALMKKYNLKEFELSQAYLFFWDKLEKANYFLENVLDTLEEPLDGRLMNQLMAAPVNDGGQWDMVANLVRKFGLVPQSLYPDSYNAMNSDSLGKLITTKLRENCLKLRYIAGQNGSTKDLEEAKKGMVREIHLILTVMLGPPPSTKDKFNWEFYDKEGKYHRVSKTPLEFASELSASSPTGSAKSSHIGYDINRLFSLVHDPRNKYFSLLTVSRLGNVYNGRPVTYVNVPMKLLKHACVRMLQKGLPVFFGCDVGQFSDKTSGVMDINLFDYEVAFNVKLGMNKAQRLRTGESQMTHAMVLTGVQVEEEESRTEAGGKDMKTVRWRVQNSWADTVGKDGFFVMTDAWMDEFCYQAVVDPSVVGKEVRDVLEYPPTVLDLWDPMGALA